MHSHLSHILTQLVIVIGTAGVTSIVFQALRLPVVLGYLLAGLLIGPHVLPSLVADAGLVDTLSDLGVILLFFTIGLEFSVRTIARVGLPTLVTVVIELSLVTIIVYAVGRGFGWTGTEAIFVAVGVAIASTMLVVKGLDEHRLAADAVEFILAMMVVEDLLSIVLLAVLSGVASGAGLSPTELAVTIGEMAGFLVAMVVAGMLLVPRTIRFVAKFGRSETLLITSLAVCFVMVWFASHAGYSIALGAFLGGMLIAESGRGAEVAVLVRPFRDMFAAIFFVSIGMMIDPALVAVHWLPVAVLAIVLVAGKSLGVSVASFLTGHGLRRSVQAGLSLSQIGEYAFILVTVGIGAGVVRDFLLPVVVGAACITAITGSWQVRASGRVASWVDAHLPRPLATFVTFYESWIARLRTTTRPHAAWRRPLVTVLVDAALLGATLIGAAEVRPIVVPWLGGVAELADGPALALLIAATALIAGLFALGLARQSIKLARLLAAEIIPTTADGALDLGSAPRRALVLTLELAIALAIGLPLAAVTQPFIPGGGLILLPMIGLLVVATRRSIVNLDSHVRAGSALIVEVLARQGREPELAEVAGMLPGFAGLTSIELSSGAAAVGRNLAELDLRARTGASVLAIVRGGVGLETLSPRETLLAGDLLAVAGSTDAIAAARTVLLAPAAVDTD